MLKSSGGVPVAPADLAAAAYRSAIRWQLAGADAPGLDATGFFKAEGRPGAVFASVATGATIGAATLSFARAASRAVTASSAKALRARSSSPSAFEPGDGGGICGVMGAAETAFVSPGPGICLSRTKPAGQAAARQPGTDKTMPCTPLCRAGPRMITTSLASGLR
jgi:hypothetical protein